MAQRQKRQEYELIMKVQDVLRSGIPQKKLKIQSSLWNLMCFSILKFSSVNTAWTSGTHKVRPWPFQLG